VCHCLRPLSAKLINMDKNPSDEFISLGFELPSIDALKGPSNHIRTRLEDAVQTLLAVLYAVPPELLITKNTPKTDRNAKLRELYAQGWNPAKLSRKYGISRTRVDELVKGVRK